jgi:hypothetical protein
MMTQNYESAVQESIKYLASKEAVNSMDKSPYWPKWNAPWWHMSVLFEMGMADRIPQDAARYLLTEVKRTHLPYFFREDAPAGKMPDQDAPCPCALGNIYQILGATGLDVDAELPWARDWFLKYQMPDGGLTCDEDAHKAEPNASSLVGTISPLEAILSGRAPLTAEEERFLDQGAKCLMERELRLGSASKYNAEERLDEEDWLKLCFPRFYFYDVLRGLSFILKWSGKRKKPIPEKLIESVILHLKKEFPEGEVTNQRLSFEGVNDRGKNPASLFPLLNAVSEVGKVSPFLSKQWAQAVSSMDRLKSMRLL